MQLLLVATCLMAESMAEPPAPDQYGPPAEGHGESPDHNRPQVNPQYGPSSASSARGHARPSAQYGAPSSGYGGGQDDSSQPSNYEFQYDVTDEEAGLKFGHQEHRDGEMAQGKYYVLLPDGRTQVVEYEADQDGYRPKISYEGGEGYGRGPSRGAAAGYNK